MLDRLSAIILLIILLPLLGFISVLILVFSGRPILYKHRRCGYQYAEFDIIKFRTMHLNNGPVITNYKDKRITGIGKILRNLKFLGLKKKFFVTKKRPKIFFLGVYNSIFHKFFSYRWTLE